MSHWKEKGTKQQSEKEIAEVEAKRVAGATTPPLPRPPARSRRHASIYMQCLWSGRSGKTEAWILACRRGSSGVAGLLVPPPFSPGATSATCPRLRGTRYSPPKEDHTQASTGKGSVHADLATILAQGRIHVTLVRTRTFSRTHRPKVPQKRWQ